MDPRPSNKCEKFRKITINWFSLFKEIKTRKFMSIDKEIQNYESEINKKASFISIKKEKK